MTERFAYDEVPYDSEANADAHPNVLGTIAKLCGLAAAPPSTCRVLEIGCGNGESLLAMATYLPRARFVGFDLAKAAIEAGRKLSPSNVELFTADVRDAPIERGAFDYVIVHGLYSWVPEAIRDDVLRQLRDALAPNGVGLLSINALPGWELRRSLRSLGRHVTRNDGDPKTKVEKTLALADAIAEAGEGERGFLGALASSARAYRVHVAEATPPDAPYPRYVFHDLLAEHNDAFSVAELEQRLQAAGLRLVCEVPLRRERLGEFRDLARVMALEGTPFLQVLVARAEANVNAPSRAAVADLSLWADFEPAGAGAYKTTTGATLRIPETHVLARAAARAPGFIPVREITDDDNVRAGLVEQLFETYVGGILTLVVEAPAIATSPERPRIADHVRKRIDAALARNASSCVLTNALHKSYEVPAADLAILKTLDGTKAVETSTEKVVFDRYRRHLYFVEDA